mmetsp:Transcript_38399/g.62411  ORF Transcript_38399/g.62411 Transcript_38399/m.62411 type:complete len:171 (-) Transcript_38399:101-613(-)
MAAMLHRGLYSLGVITCIATVSIRCYYRLCRSEQEKEKKGQREGTQIQASEEKWEALIAPGMRKEDEGNVRAWKLYTEAENGRFALKLRFEPNARFPNHWHGSAEWCFVAKGEFRDNYGTKKAGDFFFNEKASPHRELQAGVKGCELWVVKDKGTNPPMLPPYEHKCPFG